MKYVGNFFVKNLWETKAEHVKVGRKKNLTKSPQFKWKKDKIGPSHFTGFDVNLIRQVVNEGVVMLKYISI